MPTTTRGSAGAPARSRNCSSVRAGELVADLGAPLARQGAAVRARGTGRTPAGARRRHSPGSARPRRPSVRRAAAPASRAGRATPGTPCPAGPGGSSGRGTARTARRRWRVMARRAARRRRVARRRARRPRSAIRCARSSSMSDGAGRREVVRVMAQPQHRRRGERGQVPGLRRPRRVRPPGRRCAATARGRRSRGGGNPSHRRPRRARARARTRPAPHQRQVAGVRPAWPSGG